MSNVSLRDIQSSINEARNNDNLDIFDSDVTRFDEDVLSVKDEAYTIAFWGDSRYERATR